MTAEKIEPCRCGYEGALMGTDHGAFFSLQCPECQMTAEAFTIRGLGEAWNKAQHPAHGADKAAAP